MALGKFHLMEITVNFASQKQQNMNSSGLLTKSIILFLTSFFGVPYNISCCKPGGRACGAGVFLVNHFYRPGPTETINTIDDVATMTTQRNHD